MRLQKTAFILSGILALALLAAGPGVFGQGENAGKSDGGGESPPPAGPLNPLVLASQSRADLSRMIEVDVVICSASEIFSFSKGHNFMDLITLQFEYFTSEHRRDDTGIPAPGKVASALEGTQWGWLFDAKVAYNVRIANASDQRVSIIARPHLACLNGQTAEFLAGGEIVFRVSGLESGDIKPYPFGINLKVVPTIVRVVGDDDEEEKEKVLIEVEISRLSVLGRLFADQAGTVSDDDVSFDKTMVSSTAILSMNETLVLSGLYQRESRDQIKGFPYLRNLPFFRYFFSNETQAHEVLSTIVFLTPREPSKLNDELQDMAESFIQRRIKYIQARESGDEAIIESFKLEHPNWYTIAKNYIPTHLFLTNNSSLYRGLRGEDLRTEGLRHDILSIASASEAVEEGTQPTKKTRWSFLKNLFKP